MLRCQVSEPLLALHEFIDSAWQPFCLDFSFKTVAFAVLYCNIALSLASTSILRLLHRYPKFF